MNKLIAKNKKSENALVPSGYKDLADNQGKWLSEKISEKIEDSGQDREIYQTFAKKVASIKRLSEEEEYELGLKVIEHQDENAKKKLVLHNMRLALKMARQYKREWANLMDLVQEASAGMAIAAAKWDPRVGTRFGSYAVFWIRAQLTKFLMTNARLIHTANTRSGRKIYYNLPVVRKKLLLAGKNPTPELIAKELNEDEQEVRMVMSRLDAKETSLSTSIGDDGATMEDVISSNEESQEEQVIKNEIQKTIQDLIKSFEKTLKNERDLAIWRENLIASEPINLVELGKRYGVSKQRMGQLSVRIKRAFRCHIIDTLGPSTQLSWLFRED